MKPGKTIKIFEHQSLRVGESYSADDEGSSEYKFTDTHFDLLAKYLTVNPNCLFYSLLYNCIKFNQFVGVIKVGDLTIEVLPKTDRHENKSKELWQNVLLKMLLISLQVEAKTTTSASINIRSHSVLETYFQLFLDEAERLIHHGLVKKYRQVESNQPALRGKLLIHQQVTRNAVHAERFYVAHTTYDRDNVYNFIIRAALECVANNGSESLSRDAQALLLFFSKCSNRPIDEKLFHRLVYDRKTEGYRQAIELARIILLNYHPDIKGGSNDILAIMFDMNYLWESFIFWSLRRSLEKVDDSFKVYGQQSTSFWKPSSGNRLYLRPDIKISLGETNWIIDTKWKYQSKPSVEDVRQLYAYGKYFKSKQNFLLYPDNVKEKVSITEGKYYKPNDTDLENSKLSCGLMYVDLLEEGKLNKEIGVEILKTLLNH